MKNPIIHVEVIGGNASALQEFYRDAFSWRFDPPSPHALGDMQYRIAFPDDASPGVPIGVGGDVRDGLPSYVTFFVCVADLEESVRDVVRLGGKVMRSPEQAPVGGVRVALIEDPQGHLVGLVDEKSLPSDHAENDPRSIVNERVSATRAKDAASASRHFSEDAVVFDVVNPLQYAGRAAIAKRAEEWFSSFQGGIDFDVSELSLRVQKAVAFSHALHHVRGSTTVGSTIDMWWRVTTGYEKVAGDWKITHEHNSVPFDPSSGLASLNLHP
jgi:ketosteroid isomerase-like protein/predicted enzyme related to lactoylglutathione lyase